MKEDALLVTAIYMYTKYRFESQVFTAPLFIYQKKEVMRADTEAFNRQLWYLSELLVGFGLFDAGVTIEE